MPDQLIVVICGSRENFRNNQLCINGTFQILNDVNEIEPFIRSQPTSTRFIILFLDRLDQNNDPILQGLSNQPNVVATLISDNSTNILPAIQRNVLRISKQLITCKTAFYSMHAYASISQELYQAGQRSLGAIFDERINELKRWLATSIQLMACHILIIPLNTNRANLVNFQQEMMAMCRRLCPNKEIRVCTLYDYIDFDESNPLDESNFLFQYQNRADVCGFIRNLAPIRIYLVGNDRMIINNWSRLLIAKEANNGLAGVLKYNPACTFMEYEPVIPAIRDNLAGYLGIHTWQVTETKPIILRQVETDPAFKSALLRADDTLQARETDTTVKVWQRNKDFRETTPDYSDDLQSITQAQSSRTDPNDEFMETMDIRMQRDYPRSTERR